MDVYQTNDSEIFYDKGIAYNIVQTEKFDFQLLGEYSYDDDTLKFYLNIFNKTSENVTFFENNINVSYSTDFNSNNWIDLNYILPSKYEKTRSVVKKTNKLLSAVQLGYSFVNDNSKFSINNISVINDKSDENTELLLTQSIKPNSNYDGVFYVSNLENGKFKGGKRISELGNIYIKVQVKLDEEISTFYFTLSEVKK